jgi:hypothetical protein
VKDSSCSVVQRCPGVAQHGIHQSNEAVLQQVIDRHAGGQRSHQRLGDGPDERRVFEDQTLSLVIRRCLPWTALTHDTRGIGSVCPQGHPWDVPLIAARFLLWTSLTMLHAETQPFLYNGHSPNAPQGMLMVPRRKGPVHP